MTILRTGVSIAAAAAVVAITAAAPTVAAAKGSAQVHCYGVNTCKGTSDCKTAKNDCKGQGGCHVLVMRWVHDLTAFGALTQAEQERVIGRTKPDSVELPASAKPPTAHIARVEVEDAQGRELALYRRSVPYGTVAEHGLYFVAFSAERSRYDALLARMFGTSGDGIADRLTHFSRHPMRYRAWTFVSKLNGYHARFAWVSLFGVALADLYVRSVASGAISDITFF